MTTSLIPETAPFSEEQRAWLNGFLSGFIGLSANADGALATALEIMPSAIANEATESEEDLDEAPWHDAGLPLADRMELAKDKPLGHQLMAAMAQLDCGTCGYLCYSVGDALGIYPTNCVDLVGRIVVSLASEPETKVTSLGGIAKSLTSALCEDYCLKSPSDELLELLVARVDKQHVQASLKHLLDEGVPDGFDVLDALKIASNARITATEFLETLLPLNPRLYSIASSMRTVGEQVHLTVGKVAYEREGRVRKGVASCFLSERLAIGSKVRVFVQPNHGGFTVPDDPKTAMIMIGPGTGIAPFVAFLQERAQTKAAGGNWLFFGDQHAATDFLYEDELKAYQTRGLLTRLDTAFSRDGENKVYVQDRLTQNASELWKWLQGGAHLYVCGDARRMAADVDSTLRSIVATEGNLSEQEAAQYLTRLNKDKRYVRDVY